MTCSLDIFVGKVFPYNPRLFFILINDTNVELYSWCQFSYVELGYQVMGAVRLFDHKMHNFMSEAKVLFHDLHVLFGISDILIFLQIACK